MAKKEKTVVPEIVDSVEALEAKMKAMREAQKVFATFTQEQVDKIFYEAAMAANKQRIPLAKMAVEETQRGIVEDKVRNLGRKSLEEVLAKLKELNLELNQGEE